MIKDVVKYLPNATVGKDYAIELERLGGFPPLRIGLGALSGLVYEPKTGKLWGRPGGSGEYEIYAHYDEVRPELNQKYRLIVNPNPLDLWNNHPSGEEDATTKKIREGKITLLGAMRRGRLHAHYGEPSDDVFEIAAAENAFFAAVADGAGSAKNSRIAAGMAVCVAVAQAIKSYKNDFNVGVAVEAGVRAAKSALEEWERQTHAAPKDGYTTLTLLCAAKTGEVWNVGVFGVGDGAAALLCPNNFRMLTEKDSGEYCGQTLFLQNENRLKERISTYSFSAPIFLVMATDGLLDPLGLYKNAPPDNWLELGRTLRDELKLDENNLVEWLGFHARGHHDDRTLVVLSDDV